MCEKNRRWLCTWKNGRGNSCRRGGERGNEGEVGGCVDVHRRRAEGNVASVWRGGENPFLSEL